MYKLLTVCLFLFAQLLFSADATGTWKLNTSKSKYTGMPMPKVYLIDDPAPNAFATGRDPKHAVVAATTGILNVMSDRELEAVMAHEISHVRNYDIRVSMIAFGLVSAIAILSDIALRMFFFNIYASGYLFSTRISIIIRFFSWLFMSGAVF